MKHPSAFCCGDKVEEQEAPGAVEAQQLLSAGSSDCPGGSVLSHQAVSLRGPLATGGNSDTQV